MQESSERFHRPSAATPGPPGPPRPCRRLGGIAASSSRCATAMSSRLFLLLPGLVRGSNEPQPGAQVRFMRLTLPKSVGFIAATSMNCEGNVMLPAAREIVPRPSSSGCRMVSSTLRLGEYLRQKRVDLGLSQRKLAEMLGIGITDTAVEKWEKNQNQPTESNRRRIIEFLGLDPATTIPTGGS